MVERYAKKRSLDEETKKKYPSALVAKDEFEKFSKKSLLMLLICLKEIRDLCKMWLQIQHRC